MSPCWETVESDLLQQGDYLVGCHVPEYPADLPAELGRTVEVPVGVNDLIVVTQSCELQPPRLTPGRNRLVALCPIRTIAAYAKFYPAMMSTNTMAALKKHRLIGLHYLPSPNDTNDPLDALVVDFREIVSLPHAHLVSRARLMGSRRRLKSPFLESLSQQLGFYFMRVGLPETPTPGPKTA